MDGKEMLQHSQEANLPIDPNSPTSLSSILSILAFLYM